MTLDPINRPQARRALVALARAQGIIVPSVSDEETLKLLDDLVQFARGPVVPATTPLVLVPLNDLFATVPLEPAQVENVTAMRLAFTILLNRVHEALPAGRYRSLCEASLETACMWVTKGMSRIAAGVGS